MERRARGEYNHLSAVRSGTRLALRRVRGLTSSMAAVALVVGLAGCGSDHSADHGSAMAGSSALNEAETAFAEGMIPHHQQAVEMADLALAADRGASAEVVDLATRIKAAQDPEIEMMRGWLGTSGDDMPMDGSHDHGMPSMEGMMSDEQMTTLAAANGAEFDRMWLEMMIAHHQGAVSMSEAVKAAGSNPDVLKLADQIIAAQQAEIAEIQALLP